VAHHQARQSLRRCARSRSSRRLQTRAGCDPVSAFGGIIALNRPLDAETAQAIAELFAEVIISPDIDDAAKEILAAKKNLRVLLTRSMPDPYEAGR